MDKIKVSGSMPRLIRGNNLYPIIANEIGQLAEKIALLLDIPIEPVLKAKY